MKKESRGIFISKRLGIVELIKSRSKMISSMRSYLSGKGLVEVETPILNTHREGGPFIQFETEHPISGKKYFLSMCPEDKLKRVCSFFDQGIFEFARCFRGEIDSDYHLSEFTMLEIKQQKKLLCDQIELAFGLVQHTAIETFGTLTTERFDFSKLKVLACNEAIEDIMGISMFDEGLIPKSLQLLDKANVRIKDRTSEWEIMDNLIKYFIEPQMQELTFLTEFPLSLSTVSRINKEKNVANRFQIMLEGVEIGDGGEKIIEVDGYRKLYENNSVYRRDILNVSHNNEVCEEFFSDMDIASPIAGFGIGIDRFVSLILGSSINDVLLFPKCFDC